MLTVADIQPHVEREFGSRLEPWGFQRIGQRKWIRSQKLPIRELFVLSALKGAQFSPKWGFSSGFAPSFGGGIFRRQSTDKNATMDLVIDPIDITAETPPQAFSFLPGYHNEIPVEQIRKCAEHFVPLALADFDRVQSVQDFCRFFDERSQLKYRRFTFEMYVLHRLVHSFILLRSGRRDEGLERIREFCRSIDTDFENRILAEYVCAALKDTSS